MRALKLGYAAIVFTFLFTCFTSCSEEKKQTFYFTLDVLGLLRVREPMIDIPLGKQEVGKVFSFADYCEEEYDSIYLIHPYDDENVIWSLPYNMSKRLREKCCYTLNDTFVRILFIDNDTVKAYTQIGNWSAYFSTLEVIGSGPRYPFEQKFILDEKRYVHIYEE